MPDSSALVASHRYEGVLTGAIGLEVFFESIFYNYFGVAQDLSCFQRDRWKIFKLRWLSFQVRKFGGFVGGINEVCFKKCESRPSRDIKNPPQKTGMGLDI